MFLLDVSGSMHGFPLDTAKALMRNLLGELRPTDTLQHRAVLGRARTCCSPQRSVPGDARTRSPHAIACIERAARAAAAPS